MDTSPKLRQRCITQQPSHPMRKADITSACRMLAPPDTGWPLPGKPEEGCSTAGAVAAAGLKYSPKWQSTIPQSTELGKQENSVSSEKHFDAIEHQGGEKAEPHHQDQGKHHDSPLPSPVLPCPICSWRACSRLFSSTLVLTLLTLLASSPLCQDPQHGKTSTKVFVLCVIPSTHSPSASIPKYFHTSQM